MKSMEINRKYALIQLLPRLWLEVLAIIGLAILVAVMAGTRDDVSSFCQLLVFLRQPLFGYFPLSGE